MIVRSASLERMTSSASLRSVHSPPKRLKYPGLVLRSWRRAMSLRITGSAQLQEERGPGARGRAFDLLAAGGGRGQTLGACRGFFARDRFGQAPHRAIP